MARKITLDSILKKVTVIKKPRSHRPRKTAWRLQSRRNKGQDDSSRIPMEKTSLIAKSEKESENKYWISEAQFKQVMDTSFQIQDLISTIENIKTVEDDDWLSKPLSEYTIPW